MTVNQKGIKNADHNDMTEAKILANTELVECEGSIFLYYLEASLEARPI